MLCECEFNTPGSECFVSPAGLWTLQGKCHASLPPVALFPHKLLYHSQGLRFHRGHSPVQLVEEVNSFVILSVISEACIPFLLCVACGWKSEAWFQGPPLLLQGPRGHPLPTSPLSAHFFQDRFSSPPFYGLIFLSSASSNIRNPSFPSLKRALTHPGFFVSSFRLFPKAPLLWRGCWKGVDYFIFYDQQKKK